MTAAPAVAYNEKGLAVGRAFGKLLPTFLSPVKKDY